MKPAKPRHAIELEIEDLSIDDAPPLESNRAQTLRTLCEQEGLSYTTIEKLIKCAMHLRDFETRWLPRVQTPRQRSDAILEISELAARLSVAICSIDGFPELDDYWPNPRKAEWPTNISYDDQACIVQELAFEMQALSIAATKLHEKISKAKAHVGKKNVLRHYSEFIDEISAALENEAIKLARGGKFERICDYVFEAAGIQALSAGAIKYEINTATPRREAYMRRLAVKNGLDPDAYLERHRAHRSGGS
jgi:hypothetical protein